MLGGAACAGLAGAVAEFFLLRRMSGAPELYQLMATFGLSLALHDAMQWGFGVEEVFAPRFPGLKGSVRIGEEFFPVYQQAMIALGGQQQMLAIARTLMTGPKIPLLDEPCEGIAPVLVESIRDALLP